MRPDGRATTGMKKWIIFFSRFRCLEIYNFPNKNSCVTFDNLFKPHYWGSDTFIPGMERKNPSQTVANNSGIYF